MKLRNDLPPSLTIHTIGHSNVPAAKIIELIQKYEIKVLVDVRSSPYSQWDDVFDEVDKSMHTDQKVNRPLQNKSTAQATEPPKPMG